MTRRLAVLSPVFALFIASAGCTSEPPVCYESDDANRPDGPHLVRNDLGECVRVDGLDSSIELDAAVDAGATDGSRDDGDSVRSTLLQNLRVGAPAALAGTFSPEETTYAVTAPFLTSSLAIVAMPQDSRATLEIAGKAATPGESSRVNIPVGTSEVEIVVRGSGAELTSYTLEVTRARVVDFGNYFKASNTDKNDRFGAAVALSGDTLVVGAHGESSSAKLIGGNQSDNQAGGSGAVYVFRRIEGGWEQEAYIKASNTESGDAFGDAVAIEDDLLAVGAPGEDGAAREINGDDSTNTRENSGAVYIYRRSGNTWSHHAYLKASNADSNDNFGSSVALSDARLVVSAPQEASGARLVGGDSNDNSRPGSGAAYVFKLDGDNWSQEVYLKAKNADEDDVFGQSVDVSGDVVVVGAPLEDSNGSSHGNNDAENAGAVYLFRYSGSSWSEERYLKAPNAEASDLFGQSVGLEGQTLLVGAPNEDSSAHNVDGDLSNNEAGSSGAAYVFQYADATWSFDAYLKASNTGNSDSFGSAVDISHGFIAVGAHNEMSTSTMINGEDNNDELSVGAAYLFEREGTSWRPHAYLKPRAAYNDGYFGWALALDRGILAVGHQNEWGNSKGIDGSLEPALSFGSGAVHTFE